MTKDQELAILRKAVADLGPDSYCGPWLNDQLPVLEAYLRADVTPLVSFAEQRRQEREDKEQADRERAMLLENAKALAEKIVADASRDAERVRERVKADLNRCLATI